MRLTEDYGGIIIRVITTKWKMETLMEMNQSSEAGLTADEAEQYDRQIRLWGLDAQKR